MADPRIKTIKIKTGVVRRIAKEKVMYEKEADQQRGRIQKFKEEGRRWKFMLTVYFRGPFRTEMFFCEIKGTTGVQLVVIVTIAVSHVFRVRFALF